VNSIKKVLEVNNKPAVEDRHSYDNDQLLTYTTAKTMPDYVILTRILSRQKQV